MGSLRRWALNWGLLNRCVLIAVVGLLNANTALADPPEWRGGVELRGNYYWETSTRVVAPEIRGRVQTPIGLEVSGGYLLDAITSASIAAGVIADIRFTETRHQGTLGVGQEFDLGDVQMRLDLGGRISSEPDYFARALSLGSTWALNQRNTIIGLSVGYIHDDVSSVLRGDSRVGGGRDLSNRGSVGTLQGWNSSLTLTQNLSPEWLFSVGYDFVHNWGYLQNPYRAVMVQGVLRPEDHPDERTRHSAYGRLAWGISATRSSLQLLYRAYVDDWRIGAINPEFRYYQELGEHITTRLRYRFYAQSASYFYQNPDQYTVDATLVTADPKMSQFESHLVGLNTRLQLAFLENSFLDFMHRGSFDLTFEYLVQNNRFGNAVIAQVGLDLPF